MLPRENRHVLVQRWDGLSEKPSLWQHEPAFWTTRFFRPLLERCDPPLADRLDAYLTQRIARLSSRRLARGTHVLLHSHAQRVLLAIARDDADGAYGALIDLFLALGAAEQPYRIELLAAASALIGPERSAALQAHLVHGLQPSDPIPLSMRSMLSKGVTGTTALVALSEEESDSQQMDSLSMARLLITSGDVTSAKEILERALLEHPDDENLALELLELYQHLHDPDSLRLMQERLAERFPGAAATWKAMSSMFLFR
jgi:hypothetical protein